MARMSTRRTRAANLCKVFTDTELADCARPGLTTLEAEHKPLIDGGAQIACGVALDRCRREQEPNAARWDYVFTLRDEVTALAIEVHHAAATEVDPMIAKMTWARDLLGRECPSIRVSAWIWLAAPSGEIFFLRQSPSARRLADAGIQFPVKRIDLP